MMVKSLLVWPFLRSEGEWHWTLRGR